MKLSMFIDYYDLIWKSERLFDEEMINNFLGRCAESGITTIYWRVSVCGFLAYHTETPDRIDKVHVDYKYDAMRENIYKKTCEILKAFDPMAVSVKLARKHGLRIMPWLTLYDDYGLQGNHASSFQQSHPECCWKKNDDDTYLPGVVSYVHQQSIDYRIRQIRELLSYNVDGLLLSIGSHTRAPEAVKAVLAWLAENPGKNGRDFDIAYPNLRAQMRKDAYGTYGYDTDAVTAFKEKYNRSPHKEDKEWWAFRGTYLHDFLKTVRKEFDSKDQKLAMYYRQPECQQNRLIPEEFFQWSVLAKSETVDEIHYLMPDEYKSADLSFPELTKEENPWAHAVLSTGKFNYEDNIKRCEILERVLSERHFAGVSFFEAMSFFVYEENWKYISRLTNQYNK